jgi:hypothetical protein
VGGACGVRPLVVRSWPGEHIGIRTPKHAAQRTDEPRWVVGAVCRLHAGKMARVIFMVSRYDSIAIDPAKTDYFEHYSYQFRPSVKSAGIMHLTNRFNSFRLGA